MNECHAIARQYIQRVEGWHLYRSKGDRLLWIWLILVVVWVASFVPLLISLGNLSRYWIWLALVLVLEVVVLLVGGINQKRKQEALAASVSEEFGVQVVQEDECRRLLLEKLVHRPRYEFLAAAKEISDLLGLREEFRGSHELEAGFFRRHVYDPDSKARLLALTLAAVTLTMALVLRSAPEGLTIFELIGSPGLISALGTILMLCAAAFLAAVGLRAILQVVWGAAAIWVAKTFSSKESATALRRLAKDLVLFHSLKKPHEPQRDKDRERPDLTTSHGEGAPEVILRKGNRNDHVYCIGLGALIGWAAHKSFSAKRS